jgi:flap endonuclease-1
MGIKYLNRYLIHKCKKTSISCISLQRLSGKTIVIDTYIYIYKFLGEDKLLEHMDRMVSMFLNYKITPIFIFDGKPPQEKQSLLCQRREKKQEAEDKYKNILQQIESGLDSTDELKTQLIGLKKQFLKVDYDHIQCVKSILREYKVDFVDATGESDELCVQYVKSQRAWACMSDDMDMFVYGADRVLRNLSLYKHTVDLYDMKSILADLHMDMNTFRQIMVLSGTDYNTEANVTLHETLKWYHEYKKQRFTHKEMTLDFYHWLCKNTKYIQDYQKLVHVYNMFVLDDASDSSNM